MTAVQEPVQVADPRTVLAEEFRLAVADPADARQVARFYQYSRALAADLADWHTTPLRRQWTDIIVETATLNNVRSVLDFGCGRGDDLAALHAAGVEHLIGIEPNAQMAVAEAATVYPLLSDAVAQQIADSGGRDLAICIDVLEHLPDPAGQLDLLARCIPVGGLLFEATATTDVETPLHLKSNWGWSPVSQLQSLGFVQAHAWDRLRLWERVSTTAAPFPSILMAVWRGMENRTLDCVLRTIRPRAGFPRGYGFRLADNDALISRARGRVVADWYRNENSDVFLMVDGDMTFNPADADRLVELCRNGHDIIGGAYAVRSGTHLSSRPIGNTTIAFTPDAQPVEVDYVATGFMAVHRRVIEALRRVSPISHPHMEWAYWTFFTPFVKDNEELSEDWAFCERAKQLGFRCWIDPSIRLGHLGTKEWTVEDIGRPAPEPRQVELTTIPEPAALKD